MTMTPERKMIHRPYARIRGKRERSVTEIIGTKAIPNLPWGAAGETALFAVHHRDKWAILPTEDAVKALREHHKGVWNSRAAMGTATHAVMEAWIAGETVDLTDLVNVMADDTYQARSWRGREAETVETLAGYVDGLEAFWHEWQPRNVRSEECVRLPGVYIGQRDVVATLSDGVRWLLDIKTTAQHTGEKGIYGDSWALQLAAYDRAPELVEYGWNEDGKLTETGTRPNSRVGLTGVVHLRGDHRYTLYSVVTGQREYEAFLDLACVNRWLRDVRPPMAVEPPTTKQETP